MNSVKKAVYHASPDLFSDWLKHRVNITLPWGLSNFTLPYILWVWNFAFTWENLQRTHIFLKFRGKDNITWWSTNNLYASRISASFLLDILDVIGDHPKCSSPTWELESLDHHHSGKYFLHSDGGWTECITYFPKICITFLLKRM